MATSTYFSAGSKLEQRLYEDIIIESLKIYGQDVYYLPRLSTRDSPTYNTDPSISFYNDAYAIEAYIENVSGFEGDGTLLSKFGLEIRDQATFVIARRTWEKVVGLYDDRSYSNRPMEGDLLYFPLTKSFFQISFVDHKTPFYQLNNVVVYRLQCDLFVYSNERFGTGIAEIDSVQSLGAISSVALRLKANTGIFDGASGFTPMFIPGENALQTLGGSTGDSTKAIYGEVAYYYPDDKADNEGGWVLVLNGISTTDGEYHEYIEGVRVTGSSTRASWNVLEVMDLTSDRTNLKDSVTIPTIDSNNMDFERLGDQIVDFSERNPFGDISTNLGEEYFSKADSAIVYAGFFLVSTVETTVDSTNIKSDKV